MVTWIAERDAWFNTRLVCWDCNETTWKQDERLHTYHQTGATMYNHCRWWTCKECWPCA